MIEICELDTEPVFFLCRPLRAGDRRTVVAVGSSIKRYALPSTAQKFQGQCCLRPSLEVPPLIDQRKRGNCFPSQREFLPFRKYIEILQSAGDLSSHTAGWIEPNPAINRWPRVLALRNLQETDYEFRPPRPLCFMIQISHRRTQQPNHS